jgi:hypothetical protein
MKSTESKSYTKEEIKEKLATSDRWLVHGLIAVYQYQTESEKVDQMTKHENGVGFSGCDAKILTSMAEFALKRKSNGVPIENVLTEKQLVIVRRKMLKYAGQLYRIAENKN